MLPNDAPKSAFAGRVRENAISIAGALVLLAIIGLFMGLHQLYNANSYDQQIKKITKNTNFDQGQAKQVADLLAKQPYGNVKKIVYHPNDRSFTAAAVNSKTYDEVNHLGYYSSYYNRRNHYYLPSVIDHYNVTRLVVNQQNNNYQVNDDATNVSKIYVPNPAKRQENLHMAYYIIGGSVLLLITGIAYLIGGKSARIKAKQEIEDDY